MDVEVLKSEKKMILERANTEKRELTQEEKDRCHVIDKQVYDIENGFFNPSGFIKTSVKVNINAAKDDVPIPQVELKKEEHEVYVPPVGAKEVMEYDKLHAEGSSVEQIAAPVNPEPIVEEVVESTPIVEPIAASPVKPEPVVEEVVESTPIVEPIAAAEVMPEAAKVEATPVEPAAPVESAPNAEETKPKKSKNYGLIILIAIAVILFVIYLFL